MSNNDGLVPGGSKDITGGTKKIIPATTAPLSKGSMESLIRTGSARITFIRKDNECEASDSKANTKRSFVWNNFAVVCLDGAPADYVQCDGCATILSWKQGNTTSLNRHMESCKRQKDGKAGQLQMTMDQFQQKQVPGIATKELNKAITIGLAKDLKPLGMAKGKGFIHMAQQLINFGAKYGFQDAATLVYHPSTLKRNLSSIVQTRKVDIASSLKTAPSFPKFAFTTDLWTDSCQQRNFLSLSVHYIDRDFKLQCYLLGVEEFPDVEKSTVNVRKECRNILKQYLVEENDDQLNNDKDSILDQIFQKSIAVTDGGSNFVKVFENRLPCMCHKLNNMMQWLFNDKAPKQNTALPPTSKKLFVFSVECPVLSKSVSGVKNLVTFFKRSGLNSKLPETLKQENTTRWNSKLTMLKSYQKANNNVKKILVEKNEVVKLIDIDDSAVVELLEFLEPFKKCTEAWSVEKEPSIHSVVLWIHKLFDHIEIQEIDSTEIKKLKKQAKICMDEYLKVEDTHLAASMLDPKYKKLKFLDNDARGRAVAYLRKCVDNVRMDSLEQEAKVPALKEPVEKRRKFEDLEDSDLSEDDADNRHEVDIYLESKINKVKTLDLLKFWKQEAGNFPKLRKVAMEILCIPASQTTDERVFSSTGGTLSPRRTELKGSTLSDLTFIHKNFTV